jgi:predicted flap endonuclease-1-like 5' DNA nuclease
MSSLLSQNIVPIVVAILIGVVIAWWAFRRTPDKPDISETRSETAPALDSNEGNSLADEHAAATADLAGQFMGVDVHAEIPGASGPPDHLQTMKGVGPKLAAKLNENGIIRFDQLAALTPEQVAALDSRMTPFEGRIARDRIVEQAGFLARGDTAGFEQRFGKLGSS